MTGNGYKTKRDVYLEFMLQVEKVRAEKESVGRRPHYVVRWGRCVGDSIKKLARSRAGFKMRFF